MTFRRRDRAAFLSSGAYIAGMMASTAFAIYPNVLPAVEPENSLTVYNASGSAYGLAVGLVWWSIGMVLAAIYFVVARGPREYVVPIDAPETAPEPSAESDVSQVDVSGGDQAANKMPVAYQVVSEERFRAYQQTGVLPPAEPADSVPAAVGGSDTDEAGPSRPADEN